MSMFLSALTLIFLACLVHGRRVRETLPRTQGSHSQPLRPAAQQRPLQALATTLLAFVSPHAGWQVVGHTNNLANQMPEFVSRLSIHPATRLTEAVAMATTVARKGATIVEKNAKKDKMKKILAEATPEEAAWMMRRSRNRPSTLLEKEPQQMRAMIAGGGIGGLCAALVLKNAGFDVQVFEKATAYRPFGGPIQIASNALECLQRIDEGLYAKIINASTIIGDRINGLKDGISDEWFATFDLLSPAKKRKQLPSVVIDRPVLQEILLSQVSDYVQIGTEVTGYEQKPDNGGIIGHLSDGSKYEADLLVGSDGIRSMVRNKFYPNPTEPLWSGYTCFAAIANCVPDDIKTVGYKVFLGPRKYFVSVDVGGGRIQWYAFLNIPPRSLNISSSESLKWLKETQFPDWSADVHQLIDCTPVDQVEQRDLYDRSPELNWAEGNVCLLGDAAHPMMPNLGQGGGMAIEDALVLGQEMKYMREKGMRVTDIPWALGRYSDKRSVRAAAVQGLSRLSSNILFQYNPPLKASLFPPKIENLGPRSVITRACQGFLQNIAFPLQFDYLFSFPRNLVDPEVFTVTWEYPYSPERMLLEGRMSWKEFMAGFW